MLYSLSPENVMIYLRDGNLMILIDEASGQAAICNVIFIRKWDRFANQVKVMIKKIKKEKHGKG
jgi:hypothetical protein